jgi:hypothetical protein
MMLGLGKVLALRGLALATKPHLTSHSQKTTEPRIQGSIKLKSQRAL